MGKEKFIEDIKDFLKDVSKEIKIEKVILFGSRAMGNFTNESDFDLIIVSRDFKDMNFFSRVEKMYDYWKIDYPVDFLCYTPNEFKILSEKISIVTEAIKKGILIK